MSLDGLLQHLFLCTGPAIARPPALFTLLVRSKAVGAGRLHYKSCWGTAGGGQA